MRKKPQKHIKIEDIIGDQSLHPIRFRDIDQQAKQIFEQEHRRQQLIEQQKVQQIIDPNRNSHQSTHAHQSLQQQSILHNSSAQQTNNTKNNNNNNLSHGQFLLSPTGRKSVRIQERGSISSSRLPLASDRQPNSQSFQVDSSTNLTNSSVLLLPPKQFKTPLAKSSQYLSILSKSHSNTKYLNSSKVLLNESVSQSAQKLSTQISDNPNSGDQLQQQEQSGLKVSISTGSLLCFAANNPSSRKKPKVLGGQAYPLQQDLSSGQQYLQFLESIKNKLINQQQQINDEQFFDRLGNAVEYALSRIQQLEEATRIDQKQIIKLQALNAYLQISNKKKEQIYEEAVKENVAVKQQLKVLQDSMRKRQEKQQQADQKHTFIVPSSNTDIKEPNQFYYSQQQSTNPSIPTNNNNYNQLINEDHTPINERSQPYQSTSSQQPNNPSQDTFTSALIQQSILPLQAQQFDTPRAVVDSSEESQGEMQNNNSNIEGDQSIQTPATPAGLENFQDEEYIRKMRFNFVQHSTDFYFFSLLLDLTINDSQILQYYTSHKNVIFIKEQTSSQEKLQQFLKQLNKDRFGLLYDSIKHQQQIAETAVKVILKLKKIIQVVANMNSKILVPDAFEVIINETCKIIDCDRSSVFLADNERNELWTKVAKGTDTIRVPLNKGLVGHVAIKGETLNILDAHKDYRFNREVDKKTNYKTKSVLCVPIYDKTRSNVLGVLQAINKNHDGFFSKDDEGLIHILATVSQQLLRNSIFNDQNASFQQSLRSLLKIGLDLNACRTFKELIPKAEQLFTKAFDVPETKLYLFDEKTQNLYRYEEGNDTPIYSDVSVGLVGEAYRLGKTVSVLNAYTHKQFNSLADINTSLPVITMPIVSSDKNGTVAVVKYGVMTVVNQRGVEGISIRINNQAVLDDGGNVNNLKPTVGSNFEETVSSFCQIIGQISSFIFSQEEQPK